MPSDVTVALVIGAHPFDVPATMDTFDSLPGITTYPQDLPTFAAEDESRRTYDAAVFYNYHENPGYCDIPLPGEWYEMAIDAIRDLGDRGAGIVPLHHGLGAFQESADWREVTGIADNELRGAHPDQTFTVDVADPDHPITAGLSSFELTDETYDMDDPEPDNDLLLTTDHEPSMHALAWVREYRSAPVFCYACGHGPAAFGNETYRTVLARGIRWAAGADDVAVE